MMGTLVVKGLSSAISRVSGFLTQILDETNTTRENYCYAINAASVLFLWQVAHISVSKEGSNRYAKFQDNGVLFYIWGGRFQ